jgi:hypothetical protein
VQQASYHHHNQMIAKHVVIVVELESDCCRIREASSGASTGIGHDDGLGGDEVFVTTDRLFLDCFAGTEAARRTIVESPFCRRPPRPRDADLPRVTTIVETGVKVGSLVPRMRLVLPGM